MTHIKDKLRKICKNLLCQEPLKKHSSFKVGGPADYFATPETKEELKSVLAFVQSNHIPFIILGRGSNILFRDGGYRGVVICTKGLKGVQVEGNQLIALAGSSLGEVGNVAMENNLTGLEFASGIPGTLGGGTVMNAGAYGGELKDVITEVEAIDENGKLYTITKEDCDFGYRHSIFLEKNWVVTQVSMTLSKGNYETIKATTKELNQRRKDKQPLEYPSAGSTFKRPEGHFAGQLIEEAGLKGLRIGGAEVSTKHAGFVVNVGNATAKDILEVIKTVQKNIEEKYGVHLETEVQIKGEQ